MCWWARMPCFEWAKHERWRTGQCHVVLESIRVHVPFQTSWSGWLKGTVKEGERRKEMESGALAETEKRVAKIPARNQTWNPWRTWLILFHLSCWDKRRFQPVCSTIYLFCFHRLHLKPTLLTVASSHSIHFAVSLFCLFLWFTFFAVWLLSCAAPSASRCEDHRRKHLWWWAHSAESAVRLWREAWQVCSSVKSPPLPFVRSCPFYFCLS